MLALLTLAPLAKRTVTDNFGRFQRSVGQSAECVDYDNKGRPRRVPLASAISETQCLRIGHVTRCFCVTEPKHADKRMPLPVVLLHHGKGTDGSRFCISPMRHAAATRGVVLVCTNALNNSWVLGVPSTTAVPATDGCSLSDSRDLAYVSAIMRFLSLHPRRFDVRRIFQAGFSQGALFAAYTAFCLHEHGWPVAGFGQAGAGFSDTLQHVVRPTQPTLRACIWCNKNDEWCTPMEMLSALNEAGHHAEMYWTGYHGHDYPHPWMPRLFDCLRVYEPAGAALVDGNFTASSLFEPHAGCGGASRTLPERNWTRVLHVAKQARGWVEYTDLVWTILLSALQGARA